MNPEMLLITAVLLLKEGNRRITVVNFRRCTSIMNLMEIGVTPFHMTCRGRELHEFLLAQGELRETIIRNTFTDPTRLEAHPLATAVQVR
jgi:hypothetical protein